MLVDRYYYYPCIMHENTTALYKFTHDHLLLQPGACSQVTWLQSEAVVPKTYF